MYKKKISLSNIKDKDLQRLEKIITKLGYTHSDYRINYFNESKELIVLNQELHRDLKTIGRTYIYIKG